MHIGLIGGIGPAAASAYYLRLCAAMRDRQAPLELTMVHAQTLDVIARFNADDRAGQAADYARLIERLRNAGCDAAAITSIGGHFCFEETLPLSSLPLVSAISPLDDHFADRGIGRVGLLGTARVMRTALYGQLRRTEAVIPADDLDALGTVYQAMAVRGACLPVERETVIEAGRRMARDQGAEAVVLAGTDLGLAFDGQDPGYPVIDALDIHVELLADLAAGRRTLADAGAR